MYRTTNAYGDDVFRTRSGMECFPYEDPPSAWDVDEDGELTEKGMADHAAYARSMADDYYEEDYGDE
jgi:hypothetical protein